MIRLGRISYVNMAPVFHRLDVDVEEVPGVPTELNERLLAGEIDIAPISSIEYARNADRLRILPRLCVSSEGAVDSIQLVSRVPLEHVDSVAVTPESATSVVLTRILLPDAVLVPLGKKADATLLIGDAALRSAFEDPTPHHDLGRLWLERTGLPMVFAVWACPEPAPPGVLLLEEALVSSVAPRQGRARAARLRGQRALRLSGGLPRPLLREAPLQLRPARARRADHVLRARARRGRALARPRAALRRARGGLSVRATSEPGHEPWQRRPCERERRGRRDPRRTLGGERLTDEDALVLLRSRDLVRVGRAADELRNRRVDARRVTFIIDRNVNYTNICHTDCDFCAFYRRPGDRREGYLLPKPVIFKKIEETLEIGGTALLMQGGHHPDLGIEFYEDLFRSIKERYRIHLHVLSPPEIQHIARRSKLTIPETLTRLRDAGPRLGPGRRRGDPRRPRARHHRAQEDEVGRLARGHARGAPPRGLVDGDDDVRARRDARGARRAHAPDPGAPGRDARLPRLHLVDVPARRNASGGQGVTHFPTSFDYLLTQAVSRIYLDNVDHIQSSWVTQGMKVGQVALGFGADDMGSVMIEENVVSAAGTTHRATTDDFVRAIRAVGKVPVQRDTLYREVKVWG